MEKGTRFEKSPADLVERFVTVTARHPRLVPKRMFGYDCTWVNGHMATGLFADTWFVRVGEAAAAELLALPGAVSFAPMGGTPTKGYACLPPSVVADDAALDAWLKRCIAFVETLPPKRWRVRGRPGLAGDRAGDTSAGAAVPAARAV